MFVFSRVQLDYPLTLMMIPMKLVVTLPVAWEKNICRTIIQQR